MNTRRAYPSIGRCTLVLLLLVSALMLGACQSDADLPALGHFVAPGSEYSVRAPAEMQVSTHERTMDWGKLREETMHTTHLGMVLAVSVIQIPPAINAELRREPLERTLARGRDGLLTQLKASLRSERPVMLDGRPDGREIIAELTEPRSRLIARIYWVGNSIYQIRVLLPVEHSELQLKLARSFLDSLKIEADKS